MTPRYSEYLQFVQYTGNKIGMETPLTPKVMLETLNSLELDIQNKIVADNLVYKNYNYKALQLFPLLCLGFMGYSYVSKLPSVRRNKYLSPFFNNNLVCAGIFGLSGHAFLLTIGHFTSSSPGNPYDYWVIVPGCITGGLTLFSSFYFMKLINHPIWGILNPNEEWLSKLKRETLRREDPRFTNLDEQTTD